MRPNVTIHHRRTVLVAALALTILAGGAMFAYALGDAEPGAEATDSAVERSLREHAWERARAMMPRLQARMGDGRGGPATTFRGAAGPRGHAHPMRARSLDGGALFARWLAHAPDAGPVAPGLVGRVPDGTEVRLHVYDGDPAADATRLATLTYVAGTDDLAAFHAELREASADATHVVVDVLGRTVALPSAGVAGDADD
jgi:hypothetical protein